MVSSNDNVGIPKQKSKSTNGIVVRKYNSLLFGVIMVLITSSVMSLIVVSYNVYYLLCNSNPECFGPSFFNIWPRSFLLAFAVSIPIVLIVGPSLGRSLIELLDHL